MTSAVPSLATGTLAEDVFKHQFTCQSVSLVKGVVACLKTNGTDKDVTDADNANAGPVMGLVMSAGPLTAGVFGAPAVGDPLVVQRFGRASGLLATSQTIARGDKLGVVSGTGGKLGLFLPGTGMRFVGIAGQSKTTTSTSLYIEVDLGANPNAAGSSARTVTGFVGTIGAVTRYVNGINGTISTNFVPLHLCKVTGEVVRNLRIDLGTAPGGSDTVAVTVYSHAGYDTAGDASTVTCTATGAAKTASDAIHTLTLTAGDVVGLYVNSSAGTAANLTAAFDVVSPQ